MTYFYIGTPREKEAHGPQGARTFSFQFRAVDIGLAKV